MIIDTILSKLAPHECLGCSAEGALLCSNCARALPLLPEHCYKCKRLSAGSRTCSSCRQNSVLFRVIPYASYQDLAKELIWRLKFSGAQSAASEIAQLMSERLPKGDVVLVPVATATSRVRVRGYDQAVLIARALTARTKTTYAPCLRRLGQHHQVGASREQRISQLTQAYRCVRPERIAGRHVVLIDDVLTTGATIEAAARELKAAGARRVSALVFAQA